MMPSTADRDVGAVLAVAHDVAPVTATDTLPGGGRPPQKPKTDATFTPARFNEKPVWDPVERPYVETLIELKPEVETAGEVPGVSPPETPTGPSELPSLQPITIEFM